MKAHKARKGVVKTSQKEGGVTNREMFRRLAAGFLELVKGF